LINSLLEGQDIVTSGAHAEGAVGSFVVRVTDASLGLLLVPQVVSDSLVGEGGDLVILHLHVTAVSCSSELLDVVAGTVTRALIRAGGSSAALPGVSGEALTLSSLTVADTLVGALSVPMRSFGPSGGVDKGKVVVASTLRAIGSLPVGVTNIDLNVARSIAAISTECITVITLLRSNLVAVSTNCLTGTSAGHSTPRAGITSLCLGGSRATVTIHLVSVITSLPSHLLVVSIDGLHNRGSGVGTYNSTCSYTRGTSPSSFNKTSGTATIASNDVTVVARFL